MFFDLVTLTFDLVIFDLDNIDPVTFDLKL